MPIVEAMASHCIPVAYGTGNIPSLIGELGKIAPVGDLERLASLLSETINDLTPLSAAPAFSSPKGGKISLEDYDRSVSAHLETISYASFANSVAERVKKLVMPTGQPGMPVLDVRPNTLDMRPNT
jgi:hypothetical protein